MGTANQIQRKQRKPKLSAMCEPIALRIPFTDSEIVLGALKRAEGLFESWKANPNSKGGPPIFGGKVMHLLR
jgi:hypothetical protein